MAPGQVLLVAVGVLALPLALLGAELSRYPMVPVGVGAFVVAPLALGRAAPDMLRPLSPLNWAYVLFGLQLVVIPLLGIHGAFATGTLPGLPSDRAINAAVLLASLAYVCFLVGYHLHERHSGRTPAERRGTSYPARPMLLMFGVFGVLGLVGWLLFFQGLGGYIDYMSSPANQAALQEANAGSARGLAGNLLRSFLGFSVLLGWALWVDRTRVSLISRVAATLVAVPLLLATTASYNRATMVMPLLALFAAFSLRVRRIGFGTAMFLAVPILVVGFLIGQYRSTELSLSEVLTNPDLLSSDSAANPTTHLQVYGNGPQFLGYLIEQSGMGTSLYFGQTLVSSAMYPVPVLGKSFRDSSGFVLYNGLIYGEPDIIDQLIPAHGELFINFHVPGVMLGFLLIGWVTAKGQRAFVRAANSFEAVAYFFMTAWWLFLVSGSVTVVSQIFLYSMWPVYLYSLTRVAAQPRSSE